MNEPQDEPRNLAIANESADIPIPVALVNEQQHAPSHQQLPPPSYQLSERDWGCIDDYMDEYHSNMSLIYRACPTNDYKGIQKYHHPYGYIYCQVHWTLLLHQVDLDVQRRVVEMVCGGIYILDTRYECLYAMI